MNKKKALALAIAAAMTISSMPVFAAAPSKYDGQSYASLGYTSNDPDGEINLAVIANKDVYIAKDAMYIKGSVYSNGNIYVSDGQGNKIDGLFISGTEGTLYKADEIGAERFTDGYIHINRNDFTTNGITYYSVAPEYEGAIKDTETSFECAYTNFEVPAVANDKGDVEMNVYGNEWAKNLPQTVSEDTHFGTVKMNGTQNNWAGHEAALTIDTTAGDVTVVIDALAIDANPSIKVVGENKANIYIKNAGLINNLSVNNIKKAWDKPDEINGSSANTYLFLEGKDITIDNGRINANTITVNADTLTVSGSAVIKSNIESGAKEFTITGGATEVYGIVCVPNAKSQVVDSGTLYGQLHTDVLWNNGAGRIIWKADAAVVPAEKPAPTVEPTVAPTPEVTPEPTVAPTEAPAPTATPEVTPEPTPDTTPTPTPAPLPSGKEKSYKDFKYAYIFGYEPYDKDGEVILEMAPEDYMTREQVSAMLVRVDDQYGNKVGNTYTLTGDAYDSSVVPSRWSYNALAAISNTSVYDSKEGLAPDAFVTRGEVAKLVVFMMNLTDFEGTDSYPDTVGNEYDTYARIVTKAGFMNGYEDGTFRPDAVIKRAEFCSMFNRIIGRTAERGYVLETKDGTPVTHETYHFCDLKPSKWYYDDMLLATSAFDGKYVDIATRTANIRNVLDVYESQIEY